MSGRLDSRQDVFPGPFQTRLCRSGAGVYRMTRDQLEARTKKDLANLARDRGIAGWHDLRKPELIQALLEYDRKERRRERARLAKAAPVQTAAARNTSAVPSGEEQV